MSGPVDRIDQIRGAQPAPQPAAPRAGGAAPTRAFASVLAERSAGRAGGLQFSSHALARLSRRGIALDPTTVARLEEGCARVAAKGGREALVLVDDTAFVVSVRNRTVITAVDREHMREQVFTNIDSAAIA